MNIFQEILESIINEDDQLDEKVIRVKHMKQKQKALAKRYRLKNKAKLKRIRKRFKIKTKNKPKAKKGFSYGADGKLHRKVMRKGVRH